jgi:hypothetical protein
VGPTGPYKCLYCGKFFELSECLYKGTEGVLLFLHCRCMRQTLTNINVYWSKICKRSVRETRKVTDQVYIIIA